MQTSISAVMGSRPLKIKIAPKNAGKGGGKAKNPKKAPTWMKHRRHAHPFDILRTSNQLAPPYVPPGSSLPQCAYRGYKCSYVLPSLEKRVPSADGG